MRLTMVVMSRVPAVAVRGIVAALSALGAMSISFIRLEQDSG